MKRLLILGAGTAGTIMANKMRKDLPRDEWDITIVDQYKTHYYQPGFLFIPFGIYKEKDVVKQKSDFIPVGTNIIYSAIERIEPEKNHVILADGVALKYDYLIIATGTKVCPEETPGMMGDLWQKQVFDFYTIKGSSALANFFKTWKGGKLVINIAELPYKCPVAPLEFAFYADAFFAERGLRDKVDITYVTPLPGAFTKPRASKMLGGLLEQKNINVIPDFYLERVDNEKKAIVSYDNIEVPFDCLVTIPVNMGDKMIERSGMGDDLNFVPTDKKTLQSVKHENIFVIGDATNLPTSKAGSVAHFEADVLYENLMAAIEGRDFTASFDGHANCYIETGYGKGTLIDFNYDTEPLPGSFPFPGVGPFSLLKESRMNHYGKMIFRWIYWHILIKGKEMPISTEMQMAGKKK
ncbi:MAG: NAD(P)/FAD-dependent oxidoreductase [Bacteroidetes bacterium]|jgi:sulfide:quinone oxidoreductase|nr:NAD(P)/FAD-dependent oxidoreductase [Bacteroidota bacterium]MBT3801402.1 NAD(P)/FAD-dependent oxidoreductase [Bacteroidota bacterium]MBT3934862.1 NAD(P)/FAD-dependent oxidoreductase [Bacteroidota bacterium]MBT4727653.1 NAD(P)/FAD-dependent oxidoreductase [Bacteroidota bacterium]MBT4968675.1 NAD(P)/FAD-dependent oxidoreductase [Bacteroidota bacterium]